MGRYAVRISRFEDQSAFRRVLDLLGRLYPDRDPAEFEAGLARLPCLISHDAEGDVAYALRDALEGRGARVRLLPVDAVQPAVAPPAGGSQATVSRTMALSPEIDLEFLKRSAAARTRGTDEGVTIRPAPSARALPPSDPEGQSGEWGEGKAPWEK